MRKVVSVENIKDLLIKFETVLTSLRSGDVDISLQAEKFYEFGNVYACGEPEAEGFVAFYANDKKIRTAFLSMIAVMPASQGKGVGHKMLKFAEEISKTKGMEKMRLSVCKENYSAIEFYKKNGYKKITEEKTIYMEKVLE